MPPCTRGEVVMTRFAPLQANPEAFGLPARAVSHEYYRVLFSQHFLQTSGFDLDKFCYYFDRNYTFSAELAELYVQISIQVLNWKRRQVEGRVSLAYQRHADSFSFVDSRFDKPAAFHISGAAAALYALCDDEAVLEATALRAVVEQQGYSPAEAEAGLAELERLRIIWHSDNMIFGLGIPMDIAGKRLRERWPRTWPALEGLWGEPRTPEDILEASGERVFS
jgi:hypothetical protein